MSQFVAILQRPSKSLLVLGYGQVVAKSKDSNEIIIDDISNDPSLVAKLATKFIISNNFLFYNSNVKVVGILVIAATTRCHEIHKLGCFITSRL